jgi:RNA polymerase sigma-70 factor (ECF subfamily)
MSAREDEFIPTRKSLLGRLANWDDSASWQDFFNTYWKLIYSVALKSGLSHSEAQDVVQETVLAVAKNIGKFNYDPTVCAFKSWLLTVTRSKIASQHGKRKKCPPALDPLLDDNCGTPLLERAADPSAFSLDAVWEEEWQRNLVDAAICKVKSQVSIEQYQMFDLYVIKKRPVREVAETLRVTVGHVYVAKHRISRLIKKEVQFLEQKRP